MSGVPLKRAASFRGDELKAVRPMLALEHLDNWTGKLLAGASFGTAEPGQSGVAAAEPGDVLFGKLRPYLAKGMTVTEPLAASTELICMRPTAATDSRYLGYVTRSAPFVEWSVASSEGTKMPRTSWEKLGQYEICRPPLEEQRAIADYLDAETARIDALIAKKQHLIHLLEEHWQTERKARVLAGLDAVSGLGPQRKEWDYPKLGVLVGLQRGHDLPADSRRAGSVPIVSSGGISGFHDVPAALAPGVVTGRYGTVGEVFYIDEDYWPLNTTLYVKEFRGNDARWVAHLLAALPLEAESEKSAVGGINRNVIGDLRIPRPSPSEQRQIARDLDQVQACTDSLKAVLATQCDLMVERRQALITAAVTGEFQVPGAA